MSTVKMSLRTLMARRNAVRFGLNNYKYNNNYSSSSSYNNNDNPLSTTQAPSFHGFSSSLTCQTNVGGGLVPKFTQNHPSPSIKEQGECDSEDDSSSITIQKGDMVDLSQLLFTKHRGYLIKCNHHHHHVVTADQLVGKLVVIYFVPLHPHPRSEEKDLTKTLMDTYNDLKFKNCFEVVLVVVDDFATDDDDDGEFQDSSLQQKFEDIVSRCPSWFAIPFYDFTSRMRLKRRFGIFDRLSDPQVFHIDSDGVVLDSYLHRLIQSFGSVAYPFEDERVCFLNYLDKVASSSLSLKALLGSSERDFVITNEGDEVPITALENKVVALFFYEDGFSPDFLARKLKKYYAELKKNHENFEVVLLYLSDTDQTRLSTNEDTFWETFKTMPWLALPFKDPELKKLKRIFGYPDQRCGFGEPTLVVVGPRRDTIESVAYTILSEQDDLFMHEKFGKVEGERVRELKLEMLCSPTTVFERNDGSQIQFSELVGKRIIFWFEGDYPEYDGLYFHESLKGSYIDMKGTTDEFEVIYFPNNKAENCERVADVPWLVSCGVEKLPGCSAFLSFYGNRLNRYRSSYLLAFDRDGSLVRRTICPRYDDPEFPFCADIVETEAFDISFTNFCWGYWDTLYQGLLKDSKKQINFPSGDLLCCVYFY